MLMKGQFVYEYIEVIDESTFANRMVEYDREGVKHFYFMMLQKGEFIDATRRGVLPASESFLQSELLCK